MAAGNPGTLADPLERVPKAWWGKPELADAEWKLWRFDRESSKGSPLRLLKPVRYDAHCGYALGIQSDQALPQGRSDHDSPISGFASSHELRVHTFGRIDERDSDLAVLSEALEPYEKDKMRLEHVYRSTELDDGSRLYHFYGEVPPRNPEASETRVVHQGWVVRNKAGKTTVLARQATQTDADYKNIVLVTPLTVFGHPGAQFLLLQEHGYESLAFSIQEFGSGVWELFRFQESAC